MHPYDLKEKSKVEVIYLASGCHYSLGKFWFLVFVLFCFWHQVTVFILQGCGYRQIAVAMPAC